jgi:hypothetical protein
LSTAKGSLDHFVGTREAGKQKRPRACRGLIVEAEASEIVISPRTISAKILFVTGEIK